MVHWVRYLLSKYKAQQALTLVRGKVGRDWGIPGAHCTANNNLPVNSTYGEKLCLRKYDD